MIGGKQGSVGGVEAEGSCHESQVGDRWASDEPGDAVERLRVGAGGTQFQPGLRILLLADDPDLGDWLLEEVKQVGCIVALATLGKDGMKLIGSGLVDVVISEMGLADLPGMDLLRELQAMPKKPKVILTTNRHSEFLAARAIANGASAVVCEPFRMEQLLAAIVRSLVN